MSQNSYPKISVRWADHWVDYGDTTIEEVQKTAKPLYGEYTGYLVHENRQVVVLCSNVWDDGDISDPMFIMKKSIVSRSDK